MTLREALATGRALHESGGYRVVSEPPGYPRLQWLYVDSGASDWDIEWREMATHPSWVPIPLTGWVASEEAYPGMKER